jgi:hypothetical protein
MALLSLILFLASRELQEPKITWPPAVEDFNSSFVLSPAAEVGGLRRVTIPRDMANLKYTPLAMFNFAGRPLNFLVLPSPLQTRQNRPASGRPWDVFFLASGPEPYILSIGTDKLVRYPDSSHLLRSYIQKLNVERKDIPELKIVGPLTGPPPKRWPKP